MSNSIYHIYKITNTVNDKLYIGFTELTPQKRLSIHFRNARIRKKQSVLYSAMRKYLKEQFIVEELYQSEDLDYTLNTMEGHFIRLYNTHYINGYGYNMSYGGEGRLGAILTQEHKDKISKANKGHRPYIMTDEIKEKIRQTLLLKNINKPLKIKKEPTFGRGRKHSEEHKQNISLGLVGRIQSTATREKISKSRKGKFGNITIECLGMKCIFKNKLYKSINSIARKEQRHPTTIKKIIEDPKVLDCYWI